MPVFKRRKPEETSTATPAAGRPGQEDKALSDNKDTARGASADTGLGVPPFRPAPAKDAPLMARAPYTASAGAAAAAAAHPATQAAGRPVVRPAPRDPADRRTLVVGRGISVQGTVQDAERLVVEGTVEASMIHATEVSIAHGGMFKGEIEVEDAEIAGTMNGTLTARGNLVVRGTGRMMGTARCRRLQVEDGGQISGQMEMLAEETAGIVAVPTPEAV